MARSDEQTRAWLDRLEREARESPRRHALRLALLAVLGYLYPFALAALSFALVVLVLSFAPLAWEHADVGVVVLYAAALLLVLLLAVSVLGTLWVKIPPPHGHPLGQYDAKPLREMADEVSRAVGGPPVHVVHVDADVNAGVYQVPRFGFWGPRRNYLVVGVPLLASLTPAQFRAVLAHEVGHLKGQHGTFGAWIYRIHRTWVALGQPFGAAGKLRWLVIGWFVQWYGEHFALATLALRRRYEYEADARIADLGGGGAGATSGVRSRLNRAPGAVRAAIVREPDGPLAHARGSHGAVSGARRIAGETLAATSWADYRLGREFWPALLREAGRDPLPPADVVGRIASFLAAEPSPGLAERWRDDELRRRTPITTSHPCLLDRLAALGCAELLREPPPAGPRTVDESAAALLGESRQKAWGVANAMWKVQAIDRWRNEHGYAKHLAERAAKLEKGEGVVPADPAEAAWQVAQPRVQFAPPGEAVAALREFLDRYPHHGQASFTLARLLLERGDEQAAVGAFEDAMRHDSDAITPSLSILLEHYRESGRDREADPVRERLLKHDAALGRARRERLTVGRRDRFLPHGLSPAEMENVRRVLTRFPQVCAARLVRKEVSLFADKPSYVLAVDRRPGLLDDDRRRVDKLVVEGLQAQMPVACAVVVLGWTSVSLRRRLLRACQEPVFVDRG